MPELATSIHRSDVSSRRRPLRLMVPMMWDQEPCLVYEHGPAERLTAPGSRVGFAERDAS